MKKLKLIIVGTVFFLFSCQKNTDLEVAPKKEQPQESTVYDATMEHWKLVALTRDTLISVDTAKELALQIAEQMQPMGKVTKPTPIEVESIEFVKDGKKVTGTSSLTNKGNTVLQPDIYVVTFSGNQGYAVVSADNRIPGTLAYSSQGTFNLDDKNYVNKMLLKRIDNYMKRQKKMFEQKQDSLRHIALQDYFKQLPKAKQDSLVSKGIFSAEGIPTYKKEGMTAKIPGPGCGQWMHIGTTYHDWEETYRKPPLVKTLWAQTDDYNQQVSYVCPTTLKKAPVGCVAVAVGQIMAFHKKPLFFNGRAMNWNEMTQVHSWNMFANISSVSLAAKSDIQFLLANLGNSGFLNMIYGCEDSSAYDDDALSTFHALGYSQAVLENYSTYVATQEIMQNRPVYVAGCGNGDCHAWILDGYVSKKRKVHTTYYDECGEYLEYTTTERIYLVHNNFGWGGSLSGSNGSTAWYKAGVFDTDSEKQSSNMYSMKFNTDLVTIKGIQ